MSIFDDGRGGLSLIGGFALCAVISLLAGLLAEFLIGSKPADSPLPPLSEEDIHRMLTAPKESDENEDGNRFEDDRDYSFDNRGRVYE